MYDELIEQLRSRASWLEFAIIAKPSKTDGNGDAILFRKAADAIERLDAIAQTYVETVHEIEDRRKWIPVTERLPERNYNCLVADDGTIVYGYMNFTGEWMDCLGDKLKYVSHWMPLPQPPESEGE